MELHDSGGVSGARAAEPLTAENSTIRRGGERGYADYGWTDAHLTFSFAEYYEPRWMGYRSLRVLVENTIQAKDISSTHPHSDMEIVTYVADGAAVERVGLLELRALADSDVLLFDLA
jgi:redox-sensitive bicupin YhaK (pirin superfamily)